MFGPQVFGPFYLILSVLCLWEFYSLVKQSGISPNRVTGIICAALTFISAGLVAMSDNDPGCYEFLLVIIPSVVAIFIQELFKKTEAPFTNIAYTVFGIILVVLPIVFFYGLAFVNKITGFNFHFPLAFLIMLWANDTGAYLTGRAFGRTKLFERHSPKKTWEGFVGGVLISAGAALILAHFYTELKWHQWVIIAVLISFFGTTGDLIESMFKRSINVKDSGGILPGHGGLLDRFDGLFLAAPIVYTYLYFISN